MKLVQVYWKYELEESQVYPGCCYTYPDCQDDLSVYELEVLKETTDSLIEHIERIKTANAVEE